MQGKYVERKLINRLSESLDNSPAVAVLGPRQCGKSTLIKHMTQREGYLYLDLQKPEDQAKLDHGSVFFEANKEQTICLDEIQLRQDLFPLLRSIIDDNARNGQFVLLGSASRDVVNKSSESLAGRISFLELTPFLFNEVGGDVYDYWLKGGFPRSYLSELKASINWRENFTRTFLERDIPSMGFKIPFHLISRLWQLCANSQGNLLNVSKFAEQFGVSSPSMKSYLQILEHTFMLRLLKPFSNNLKKRLVKSPKMYVRDSGILHNLLKIDSFNELISHPVFGASFETMVIENLIAKYPDWEPFFYRTAAGAELDLILVRGQKKMAFEIKASNTPKITKGLWKAKEDLDLNEVKVISLVERAYEVGDGVSVLAAKDVLAN